MSDAHIRTFDDDQTRRLLEVHRQVDTRLTARDLLRRLTVDLADIAGVAASLVEWRDGFWTTLATSSTVPRLPAPSDPSWGDLAALAATLGRSVVVWRGGPVEWTVVGLRARSQAAVLLLFEGDWTGSGEALLQLAQNLTVAERVAAMATQTELALATHRLTRVLGRISGERRVCELALRYLVRAVPSRLAAFAVPTPDDQLAILATHGYARTLVDHVRVRRGEGVLGTVFETRAPLRVHDTSVFLGTERSRARYRTRSFLVLPVLAGRDLVGVVSLTDRADDGPYRREDMTVLRALLAPVSLALGREGQRREAALLAQAAATDAGSGLFNRRYFQGRLEEELQRARRMNVPLALLMLDLDHFKIVNDQYGHVAGDEVIAALAEIMRRAVRVFDVCARYGGEEFVVLLPNITREHAVATAERIRRQVEAYRPSDAHLRDLRLTISVGLAMASESTTGHDLVERADQALYAAKRAGRNRVVAM